MAHKRWTEEEVEYLAKYYHEKDIATIAKNLNRTNKSVSLKAAKLELTKIVRRWTNEEIDFLIQNWGKLTQTTLAKKINRSQNSIKKKAVELKIGPERIGNGEYLTNGDIGYLLNKDKRSIYRWTKEGYIQGRRFGNKGIFQIKPENFITFLKKYPDKWNGYKARVDYIKPYFCTSEQFDIPSWFIEKIQYDTP